MTKFFKRIMEVNMENKNKKPNGAALLPFLLFILIYLGSGIILQSRGVEMAFYQFPAPVAIMIAIIVAFFMFKGSTDEKLADFIKGCGDENILTMCLIYLFAGAFASVASAMGGVTATANLGLSLIPAQFITAGIFFIAAFLSISTGSSMGTISALGPIAITSADTAGLNMPLMMAALVGGAMFGDNLSIISDTTIAATRTQGCDMRDKFKVNFTIALPAAILTFVLLLILGKPENPVPLDSLEYSLIKVVPYILVLVLAVIGVNVFYTLGCGIVIAGIIGLVSGDITFLGFVNSIYGGFSGMTEIFLLSLLTGGLAYMVTKQGGLDWLILKIKGLIKGKKSAEIGIAAIASVADMAVANNTVAIIITGPISKSICEEYKVDPRRSASLLDMWTCIFQGFIPYGAQVLLACSLTANASVQVSPLSLFPLLWYQQLLAVFAIISIFVPFADKVIKKHPWDFKNWKVSEKA